MLNSYLDIINTRLSEHFNVKKHFYLNEQSIDLFATLEVRNEKYFLSKNVKLWRAENYEYVFVKSFNDLTKQNLQEFIKYLQNAIAYFVKPHSEHMESLVTGVLIVDQEPDSQLQAQIRSFRYRKNFKLTLQGWAEIRLILVIPSSNKVIANKRGKEVRNFYTPIFKQTQLDRGLNKLKRIVTFKKM
ncbi:MAG: hypothetical protein QMC95_04525 [Desulfitobacteriaceae bacterium]|nr:hypothetical protein [Desulfitobacteriaceae bacterium]MDI6913466.1 hypothetical protein [Desulfitobacteriaceae bacterium]